MIFQRIARKLNKITARYYLAFPQQVECNICGWQGKHFISDDWHENVICPQCGLDVRHRLLWASLREIEAFNLEKLVQRKQVLHFAAESQFSAKFSALAANYKTADFLKTNYDYQLDLSDMSMIADESIDLLIACDVLEHVPDHLKAIAEIHRVLSPEGCAIITVPQKDHLVETFEDPTIVDPQAREEIFGQVDHVRVYGDDFPSFLEKADFKLTIIDKTSFSEDLIHKWVLFPPKLSTRPLATNYRKIFFAQKN
jgi:SAM-dependent methyltransferase